jgi:hypothetical protein
MKIYVKLDMKERAKKKLQAKKVSATKHETKHETCNGPKKFDRKNLRKTKGGARIS